MAAKVKLGEVVDAFDVQRDAGDAWLNRTTGETFNNVGPGQGIRALSEYSEEDARRLPEWIREVAEILDAIDSTTDWVRLPEEDELDEWQLMSDFAASLPQARRETLLNANDGRGTFRAFRQFVGGWGIEDEWDAFRTGEIEKLLIDWLDDRGIDWER